MFLIKYAAYVDVDSYVSTNIVWHRCIIFRLSEAAK